MSKISWLKRRPNKGDKLAIILDIMIIISTSISALMIYSYLEDFNRIYVSTFAIVGLFFLIFLTVAIYYSLILLQQLVLLPNYFRLGLIIILLILVIPQDYSGLLPGRTIKKISEEDKKYLSAITKEIEYEVLKFSNKERVLRNLTPMVWDSELASIARLHSLDMIKSDFFSHINPDRKNPTDRARDSGYITHDFILKWFQGGIAENIGIMPTGNVKDIGVVDNKADSIAAAQVYSWMMSANHSVNIIDPHARKMGVGVAQKGREYVITQNIY